MKLTKALLTGCLVLTAGCTGFWALTHRQAADHTVAVSAGHPNTVNVNAPVRTVGVDSSYTRMRRGIYYKNRVVVVTFHDMTTSHASHWSMTPSAFQADLDALESNGFHVISNRQFIGWLQHRNSVPPNAVLLTFDDGYQSMYTEALPILLRHHMTGTFFVIVGRQDQHAPGFLSWGELKTMVHDGMTVASHTYNSHYLVNVIGSNKQFPVFDTPILVNGKKETEYQTYLRDYADFRRARDELQTRLGITVNEFAWPYGWGTDLARKAALAAGYSYIFTTFPSCVTPQTNREAIPRIDIGYSNTTPQQAIQDILRAAGAHVTVDGGKA